MAFNLSIAFFIWNLWLWSYHQISTHLKFHLLACRSQPKLTALSSAGGWILSSRGPGHHRCSSSRWKVGEKNTKFQAPNFDCRHPTVPGKFVWVFLFSFGFCCEEILPTWRGVQKTSIKSISLWCRGGFYRGELFSNCQGRHLILGQDHVYDLLMNFLSLKNIKLRDGRIRRFFGVWDRTMSQSFTVGGVKNQNAKISSTRDLHHFRQNQCHLPRTPKFKTFPIPFDHMFQGPRFNHLLTVIFDGQLGEG